MTNEQKYRVFEINSQEPYLTKDKIENGLRMRSIKEYAYILHDKDVYTEKQIEKLVKKGVDVSNYNVGDLKAKHWHCYIVVNPAQTIKTIAKWFDVAPQYVEVKKGAGAFVDCLEYAVHDSETAKNDGKYPYPFTDVYSNVDVEMLVREKQIRRSKYNRDLNERDSLRMMVLDDGLTLREASKKYPVAYSNDLNTLKALRGEYLHNKAELPYTRYNFYICGSGGVGKDTIGRGFARQFYPDMEDDDIFHVVKDIRVPFDGYDGQPVIIWEDVRAVDLITTFGRSGVFRLFDINPTRGRYNVKYGSVVLCNTINILTSVEDYPKFLNELSGEYTDRYGNDRQSEDKGQAYRRFPFIIPITMGYMDILVQKAYLEGNNNYFEYENFQRLQGNLAQMIWSKKLQSLPKEKRDIVAKEVEKRYLSGAIGKLDKLMTDNKSLMDSAIDDINSIIEDIMSDNMQDDNGFMQVTDSDLPFND